MLGKPLMPWQQYVADVALEVDPVTGWWAYDTVELTVQRRAGKSALWEAVAAHRMVSGQNRRCWMTAQSGTKALDRWNDVKTSFEASELAKQVRGYTSIGHERILWKSNGSTLKPFAPNGDLLHGEAIDLLGVDEQWIYTAEMALSMKGGYRPAFLTTNAQAWLLSTAGTPASAWLNQERHDGRAAVERGDTRGTAYFEWSMLEMIGGVALEDIEDDAVIIAAALAAHPAIEHHPNVPAERMRSVIAADYGVLGRSEFIRAYGNLTASSDADKLIPQTVIVASTTLDRIPADVAPGIAFDVDPDRRAATISAGWRDPDTGKALVEVIEHGLGTRWTASAVIGVLERQGLKRVTANNAGPARDVADEIERAGFEVQRVTAPDYAAACVRYHDEIKTTPVPSVQHYGQADLVDAFGHVVWRRLGQSMAFHTTTEPITPVTSSTLALWGADHPPEIEKPLPQPFVV